METRELLEQALKLPAAERFELMQELQQSLDRPDAEVDRRWGEEALRRVQAYDEGRVTNTYSIDEVLGEP